MAPVRARVTCPESVPPGVGVCVPQDQFVSQVSYPGRGPSGQRVASRQADADRFLVQRPYLQPVRRQRQADEPGVDPAVEERRGVVPPPQALKLDLDIRVAAGEPRHDRANVQRSATATQ